MGIHLCVVRVAGGEGFDEVPDSAWDSMRHTGDFEFAKIILCNPILTRVETFYGDRYFRPLVPSAWKDWDAGFGCNAGRWAGLTDLLLSDAGLWVYVSV